MSTLNPAQIEVAVGEYYQNTESLKSNPRKIVRVTTIHPDYQDKNKIHDIAVLKLHDNISWSSTAQPQ
ncbi:unnamed protein product [Allacma fusca]|uniref:Peptidase S1 domain-containing protein n=1 Tax=Allacma fusca TaxID=39272 RepID=A0A8J2P8I3_9HEXA|nr:unnamed protein product [Allacma fusca]